MTYDSFPLIQFFEILVDESKRKSFGIALEDWESIKKEWINKHENLETDTAFLAKRNELKHRSRYNMLIFLRQRATLSEHSLKELYGQLGLRWEEDRENRMQHLDKEVAKAKKLQEIFEGQSKSLEDEKKGEDKQFRMSDLYQSIASLELNGANIPDYNDLTLGKYDALTAVIEKRNGQRRTN